MLNLIRRFIGRQVLRALLLNPIRILLAATGPSTLEQLTGHTGLRRTMIQRTLDGLTAHGWLLEDPFHRGRYQVSETGRAPLTLVLERLSR